MVTWNMLFFGASNKLKSYNRTTPLVAFANNLQAKWNNIGGAYNNTMKKVLQSIILQTWNLFFSSYLHCCFFLVSPCLPFAPFPFSPTRRKKVYFTTPNSIRFFKCKCHVQQNYNWNLFFTKFHQKVNFNKLQTTSTW